MTKQYKTPGVYVAEESSFGSSIISNPTAIPSFIGFTERTLNSIGNELNLIKGSTIVREPILVQSLLEYQTAFGEADVSGIIDVTEDNDTYSAKNKKDNTDYTPSLMEPSISNFFLNGGGSCYIISLGSYDDFNLTEMPTTITDEMNFIEQAIELAETTTLIIPTDLSRFGQVNYYAWSTQLINFVGEGKKCFAILDVIQNDSNSSAFNNDDIENYRKCVLPEFISYAAAYYPYLKSTTAYGYKSDLSNVSLNGNPLRSESESTIDSVKAFLAINYMNMPPSSFMAGIYSRVDNGHGVWRAPANISIIGVVGPLVDITNGEQENLNIDAVTGKSINAIRDFTGRGTLVRGARTNDGNGFDWRYVNVRRLAISLETDIGLALQAYVFKPNTPITWREIKTMIESYLHGLYEQGAFAGTSPKESYQVLIGVGETMTGQDLLNGCMRVTIQVAPVRPAEFIVLTFSQMMES
jgi:phage tail sheath protein FI